MRRTLALLLACCLFSPAFAETGEAYSRGTVGLGHLLLRLQSTARVLHTGAHPDDEDTALLATLARGYGARVVYYSLNRGEGGQNSLGPEQDEALGVLRTEELLAARRVDGAEQWFGLTHDFGFSRSAAETLAQWGEAAVLGDLVEAIRRLRPQVVISRFSGTPADGHGHHQACGLLTRRACEIAGDPAAYPEQLAAGLLPWAPAKLYLDAYQQDQPGTILPLGDHAPLYGRSFAHLALESRSLHRSQDMGRLEPRGPFVARLQRLDRSVTDNAWSDGLDVTLTGLLPQPAEGWQQTVATQLAEAADGVKQAQALFALNLYPRQTQVALARTVRALRRANEVLSGDGVPLDALTAPVRQAVGQKLEEAQAALLLAAGVELDALADQPFVAPGDALTVAGLAWWHPTCPLSATRLTLNAPSGWQVEPLTKVPRMEHGEPQAGQGWLLRVPADAAPTQPYWLREPRRGERYEVPEAALRGRPQTPAPLTVQLRCAIDDTIVSLTVPVQHRRADSHYGEQRQAVQVQPAMQATLRPSLLLMREQMASYPVAVDLANTSQRDLSGTLRLLAGDRELARQQVSLGGGRQEALSVPVVVGELTGPTTAELVWEPADGGRQPLWTAQRIAYPHIATRLLLTPARLRLVPGEVAVDPAARVGYIAGAADELGDALRQLGYQARAIDPAALADGTTLDGLTCLVIGARAYETEPALPAHNARLLSWVARGGRLLVCYQRQGYTQANLAPYPLTTATPHDRVTDETATVTLRQPEHPLLRWPNRIGEADFAGWVQERGLYFQHTWDPRYSALLSCADPDQEPAEGGLLTAAVERGQYTYCGYALHRQWSAGVLGAYRLLANLTASAAP